MPDALDRYFRAQAHRWSAYGGQLADGFQEALRRRHEGVEPADCEFYHTVALPDGRVHPGEWDLRGREDDHLGGLNFSGKRVVEYGPASGWLSAHIARQGAELIVFDLPFGAAADLMPIPGVDLGACRSAGAETLARVRNSWWYVKRELGFEARAVYADVCEPPEDLGGFDVAVFGAILLHLSNPFRALQRAAARTRETIVVTDVLGPQESLLRDASPAERELPLLVFGPSPAPSGVVHWWAMSPPAVRHMLRRLGFGESSCRFHADAPLFTVTARRTDAAGA